MQYIFNFIRNNRKKTIIVSFILVFLSSSLSIYQLFIAKSSLATWAPGFESWLKRKQITLTNNSAGTVSTNSTVAITIDTQSLFASGYLQNDCDDLRVVYESGTTNKELTRYIVFPRGTDCSTSNASKVYFNLQADIASSASSTSYYIYYNNGSASSPSSTDNAFDISSIDAKFVCPFDATTTCAASEIPTNETGAVRYSGSKSALSFDGESDYITAGNIGSGIQTIEFWVYPNSTTNYFIDLNGTANIDVLGGTVRANNITGATIYVNGVALSTLSTNTWSHVSVTATTAINASNVYLGKISSNYLTGRLEEVRLSSIVRYSSSFTPPTSPFTRDDYTKLLLHFDENDNDPRNLGYAIDDSGNGNHGAITGAEYVSGLVGVDSSTSDTGYEYRQTYASHEGIFAEEGNINKITNPSFDHATYDTNWDAVGANLTASENTTAPYYKFGSKSLKLIANASAISGTSNMDTISIDPNATTTHTLSFYAYDATSGNVGGTVSSSIVKPVWEGVAQSGGTYSDMGGGWWKVTYSSATTDLTNEYGVEVQVSKTVYIDGVQLEEKSYATSYSDGTLGTGYGWDTDCDGTADGGTAHQSCSTRTMPQIKYSGSGNINNTAGSISAWVKPQVSPRGTTSSGILGFNKDENDDFRIGMESNRFYFYIDGTTYNTTTPTVGNWYHVVATWDSSGNRILYVNNSASSTGTGVSITSVPSSFYVGTIGSNSSTCTDDDCPADAVISDLRIFNSNLSSTQVSDLYYAGLVGHSQGITVERFSQDKDQDPVAIYHFDEGSGSYNYDSSIYGNNLTVTNATWFLGNRYTAMQFDGDGDYLSRIQDSDFDFGTGSFSISGFFKRASGISTQETILSKYGSAGYKVYLNSSGYVCFGIDSDSTWSPTDEACSTTSFADNTWHHFEAVKDSTTLTLYVDANQVGQDTSITSSTLSASSTLYIGIDSDGASNDFTGYLDEFIIYPYARNAAQVKTDLAGGQMADVFAFTANHNVTLGSKADAPLVYYKFDEGNGTTANNSGSSGSSYNGTITSGTWTNSGRIGKAITFTASSSVTATITDPGYTNSISLWIYPTTSVASKTLVSTSKLTTDSSSRPTYGNCTGTALSLNTWTHLLAVSDGSGSCVIYQNGSPTSTSSAGVTFGTSLDIGGSSFTGRIDDVKLFASALTAAQAKIEYNLGMSQVLGAVSTDASDNSSWSSERSYCPPGDTTTNCSPVGEWKLDENNGTTSTYDTSGNGLTGTLTNIEEGDWTAGKMGSALILDGNDEYIDIGTGPSSVKSIEFWVYPITTTEYYINLTSNTDYIWSNAGTVTATGLTSPIIYIDGIKTISITAGYWHHVVVTTDTAENASNLDLGRTQDTNYLEGKIDNIKLYNYALSPSQIAWNYNQGASQVRYKFDECSGSTLNNSAPAASGEDSSNDATVYPTTNSNDTTGNCNSGDTTEMWNNGTTGKYNSSLDFDGSDDYAATSNSALLASNSTSYSNLSWGGWFYPSTATASDTLIHKGNEFKLTTDASGYPQCEIYSGSWQTAAADTTALPTTSWSHVLCTYDGSNIKLYINGYLKDTQAETDTLTSTNSTPLSIARDSAGSGYFDGKTDELKIWSYDLTPLQIKTDYNIGSSVRY